MNHLEMRFILQMKNFQLIKRTFMDLFPVSPGNCTCELVNLWTTRDVYHWLTRPFPSIGKTQKKTTPVYPVYRIHPWPCKFPCVKCFCLFVGWKQQNNHGVFPRASFGIRLLWSYFLDSKSWRFDLKHRFFGKKTRCQVGHIQPKWEWTFLKLLETHQVD